MKFKPKDPRFPECRDCRFFRYGNTSPKCGDCGAGESFEEIIDEFDPDEDDLMQAFRRNTHDDE